MAGLYNEKFPYPYTETFDEYPSFAGMDLPLVYPKRKKSVQEQLGDLFGEIENINTLSLKELVKKKKNSDRINSGEKKRIARSVLLGFDEDTAWLRNI
jgi:hypothetical protein